MIRFHQHQVAITRKRTTGKVPRELAFGFHHKHFGGIVMGKGPSHRTSGIFGDQDDAVFLDVAAQELAPMFPGKIGIAAAVGFESRLIVLQSMDEGQDRRFVGGKSGGPDANGRAP